MKAAIEPAASNAALRDDAVGRDDAVPADEPERLASLRRLGLLDAASAPGFDAVARLAASTLAAPVVVISLVDEQRLWCLSRVGLQGPDPSRQGSFCSQVVLQRGPLLVRDAAKEARFAKSAWVAGPQRLRSYAGVPIYTRDGQPVGTLSAMDAQAHRFGDSDLAVLAEFAKILEEFLAAKEGAAKADEVLQYAMEREKLFRETFEQAAVGIVHTALSGAVLRANQRACALLGYAPAQLRELTFQRITHAEDLERNVLEFKRLLAGDIDSYRLEQRLLCHDQRYLWMHVSVALKRSFGQPDYGIVVIDDISALKQAPAELATACEVLQDKLTLQAHRLKESQDALQLKAAAAAEALEAQRAAEAALQAAKAQLHAAHSKLAEENFTDPLTQLPNRRSFSRRSDQAAQALRASRKAYGLILLDLDNLKRINEEYGHDTGDEVLRAVGKILSTELRNSSDMAAHLGGEEFAVMCFGDINEQTLHDVAQRIQERLGKEALATPRGLLRFTASFGLTLSMNEDVDWKSVYGRADAALQEAKAAGRDRISFGRSQKSATARLRALSGVTPPAT